MFLNPEISMPAKGMMGILKEIGWTNNKKEFEARVSVLEKFTGYSGNQILNILNELETKGAITVKRGDRPGIANKYTLNY